MNKPKWEDTSAWSRSDKDRSVAKEWTIKSGDLVITIHHYIGCGQAWYVSCHALKISRNDLSTNDAEMAKSRALNLVKKILEDLVKEFKEIPDE